MMVPPAGLRVVSDMALAAGQRWTNGMLPLPPSMGTGFIKHLTPEPGLRLTIHRYTLATELVLRRVADETQPETLLLSFHAFGAATAPHPHLSTAQLATTHVGFTTTLPAHTAIFIVALSISKQLITTWLLGEAKLFSALFTTRSLLVLDTLLTPNLQAVLHQITAPRPDHELDALFYRIKSQELFYWLLRELTARATVPARPLHPADAEKIFQVRAALVASLSMPPSLPQLAQAAGLSETKMRQLFRQVFGSGLFAYFQTARMEAARHQLDDQPVAEVGDQLGFTNLSHFARLFQKHYGLTPKKYQATRRL